MSATRFRAPPADALVIRALDGLYALYHRPSGTTHLLASPAPELLHLLAGAALTQQEVLDALLARYDVPDAAAGSLAARLDELVACGLVDAT